MISVGSRGAGVGSRIAPSFGSGKRGLGVIGAVVRAVTNNKYHRGYQGLATERYNVCVVETPRHLVPGRSKKKALSQEGKYRSKYLWKRVGTEEIVQWNRRYSVMKFS